MRTLTRVSLLAAALILLAGGYRCLAAGGASGVKAEQARQTAAAKAAQSAGTQARLDAARKAVDEAKLRVKTAQMRLADANARLEDGLASQDDVSNQELALAAASTALANAEAKLAALQASGEARVTLALTNADIRTALSKLFEGTGQSFVLDPNAADGRPVTVTLNDVEFGKALAAACEAAGLQSTEKDGVWIITKRPDMATIGGVRLPVVGTMGTTWTTEGESRILRQLSGGGGLADLSEPGAPKHPSFKGEDTLVDLDVKDMPLSQVAERLSHKVPPPAPKTASPNTIEEYRSLEIAVDDSIRDLKVTAKIHKWPLGKVLDMLISQANLACSREDVLGEPVPAVASQFRAVEGRSVRVYMPGSSVRAPTTKLYLVPRPELSVSMPLWPRLPKAALTPPPGQH